MEELNSKKLAAINALSNPQSSLEEVLASLSRIFNISITSKKEENKKIDTLFENNSTSFIPKIQYTDLPNASLDSSTSSESNFSKKYGGIYNGQYESLVEADMQKVPYDNPSSSTNNIFSNNNSSDSRLLLNNEENITMNGTSELPYSRQTSSKGMSLTKKLVNPGAPQGYHYEGAEQKEFEIVNNYSNSEFIMEDNNIGIQTPNNFAGATTVSPEDFVNSSAVRI